MGSQTARQPDRWIFCFVMISLQGYCSGKECDWTLSDHETEEEWGCREPWRRAAYIEGGWPTSWWALWRKKEKRGFNTGPAAISGTCWCYIASVWRTMKKCPFPLSPYAFQSLSYWEGTHVTHGSQWDGRRWQGLLQLLVTNIFHRTWAWFFWSHIGSYVQSHRTA